MELPGGSQNPCTCKNSSRNLAWPVAKATSTSDGRSDRKADAGNASLQSDADALLGESMWTSSLSLSLKPRLLVGADHIPNSNIQGVISFKN